MAQSSGAFPRRHGCRRCRGGPGLRAGCGSVGAHHALPIPGGGHRPWQHVALAMNESASHGAPAVFASTAATSSRRPWRPGSASRRRTARGDSGLPPLTPALPMPRCRVWPAGMLGEMLIQHRQGHVGEHGGENPTLRVPVSLSRSTPSSPRTPALRNAFTRRGRVCPRPCPAPGPSAPDAQSH